MHLTRIFFMVYITYQMKPLDISFALSFFFLEHIYGRDVHGFSLCIASVNPKGLLYSTRVNSKHVKAFFFGFSVLANLTEDRLLKKLTS